MAAAQTTPTPKTKQERQTGVYIIRNTKDGKCYVGSAAYSLAKRLGQHRSELRGNYHYNQRLQRAWNKHGEAVFTFLVHEYCEPSACLAREQHWIDTLRACDPRFGYNICPTAGSNLGRKFSAETRAKIVAANVGKKLSTEHRAKIGAANVGRRNTPETIAKMVQAAKDRYHEGRGFIPGKLHTEEEKAKISAANKGRGLGKKWDKETRAKIRAAQKARERGHKLTLADVKEIRRRHKPRDPKNSVLALSKEFGVSTVMICNIVSRRCWNKGDETSP